MRNNSLDRKVEAFLFLYEKISTAKAVLFYLQNLQQSDVVFSLTIFDVTIYITIIKVNIYKSQGVKFMSKDKKHLQKNFILKEFYIVPCVDKLFLNAGAILHNAISVDGTMMVYSIKITIMRAAVTKRV